MLTEIYKIEDASNEVSQAANDHEAMELIASLGLTGQTKILNKDTVTRVPYRIAEAVEIQVFKALNPEHCAVETYDLDPIPVRILQELAFARSLNYFKNFEIWYPKAARVEDPVLVGYWVGKRDGRSWDSTDTYILARWGKSLKPFNEMLTEAIDTYRQRAIDKLKLIQTKVTVLQESVRTTKDLDVLTSDFYHSFPQV